jgi:hypothetical protein
MVHGASTCRRKAVAVFWIAAMVTGLPPGAAVASADEADPDSGCPVLAYAQGVMVTVSQTDNVLIGTPTGAGVPVAQACVDYGVGDSLAFASSPYPGETLVGLPGSLAGQTGQQVPAYPAYAGTRYPATPQASVSQPGVSLLARSSETASHAEASHAIDQVPVGGPTVSTADVSVDPAAGTSAATAKADLRPLTINGVLILGEVVSSASAARNKAGTVTRSSQLQIGRTTVAGQEVAITPAGVQVPGQTVGLPDTGAVTQALAQAGITVQYLAPQNTARGILSAGVDITAVSKDSTSGTVTTWHYVVGRSFATVAPVDAAPGGDAGLGSPGTPASDAGSSPVAPDTAPAAALAPAPMAPGPALAAPASAAARPATGAVAPAGHPVDMGLGIAYLTLVCGAMVMFLNGTLVRLLGVKTRWTS